MAGLGDKVQDKISGFRGIVIARTEYLNGCARCGVQPSVDKEGKLPSHEYFDEPQLKVLKAEAVKMFGDSTGGPPPYAVKPRIEPRRAPSG